MYFTALKEGQAKVLDDAGVETDVYLGCHLRQWWESIRTRFGRGETVTVTEGQAPKKPTPRDLWVARNCSFLSGKITHHVNVRLAVSIKK